MSKESGQTLVSVQALANSKVLDSDNKEMGTVKNIMVDPESGKLVRADIRLGSGGLLGLGSAEQRVSVPWEQLSLKQREGSLVLVANQQVIDKIKTDQEKQTSQQKKQETRRQGSAASEPKAK